MCKTLFIEILNYFYAFTMQFFAKSALPEDARLNFTQLAEKYGRKCEVYDVVTEDNYILKLFRIKGNESKPVLLGHGFIMTADTFIMRGKTSPALALADKGYDVWVLNFRGNEYGRGHLTLNPDIDKEFWNFSFHEMAVKDLPAHIDFVLNKTKQSQLIYIGHSQGSQIGFVLGSLKSEYNGKMKANIALAPIAFLHNMQLAIPAKLLWPVINMVLQANSSEEIAKKSWPAIKSLRRYCSQKDGYENCAKRIIFEIMGYDSPEMEPEFFKVFIRHYISPTSRKNVDHLAQLMIREKFSQYDYGLINMVVYGTLEPPDYPLEEITSPVYLLVGLNDRLSVIADVEILRSKLHDPYYYQIKRKVMNHVDFIIGKHMDKYLYPVLFEILQNHTLV